MYTRRVLVVLLLSIVSAVPAMGAVLPPFALPLLSGGCVTDLDLTGQTMLLFVVPDSEACITALDLVGTQLQCDARDVNVWVVVPEESDAAHQMTADPGFIWPVIVDDHGLIASVLRIDCVPTVCLFDAGEQVGRLEHEFTAEQLAEALAEPLGISAWAESHNADPIEPVMGFMALQEPLLLFFAGADCSYCHYMLPAVVEVAQFMDTWLVVGGEITDSEAFERDAARLSILLDPQWRMAFAFDIPSVPTLFFIAPNGEIVWSHAGIVRGLSIVAETFRDRVALP